MALYHSVGASDPIVASEIRAHIADGLPETLPEWIRYNGLRRIKIKLAGNDLTWGPRARGRNRPGHRGNSKRAVETRSCDWKTSGPICLAVPASPPAEQTDPAPSGGQARA